MYEKGRFEMKKTWNKVVVVALSCMMAFALAACGGGSGDAGRCDCVRRMRFLQTNAVFRQEGMSQPAVIDDETSFLSIDVHS